MIKQAQLHHRIINGGLGLLAFVALVVIGMALPNKQAVNVNPASLTADINTSTSNSAIDQNVRSLGQMMRLINQVKSKTKSGLTAAQANSERSKLHFIPISSTKKLSGKAMAAVALADDEQLFSVKANKIALSLSQIAATRSLRGVVATNITADLTTAVADSNEAAKLAANQELALSQGAAFSSVVSSDLNSAALDDSVTLSALKTIATKVEAY